MVQRANPEAKAISEADATVERIILERRKEMIGEGQRYLMHCAIMKQSFAIKMKVIRGYHYSLIKESQSFDRTYFRAILPIPVDETNVNP
ncbi:RagB/SusD family nutrient uptake outer membrane protein [Bacteroides fragilis]|nr:RagB/SusD family nutrient uptake outer membrane protein [Bacteroides fragilis]